MILDGFRKFDRSITKAKDKDLPPEPEHLVLPEGSVLSMRHIRDAITAISATSPNHHYHHWADSIIWTTNDTGS